MSAEWCHIKNRLCNRYVNNKCMDKKCMFEEEYNISDNIIAKEAKEGVSYAMPSGPPPEAISPMPEALTTIKIPENASATLTKIASNMGKQLSEAIAGVKHDKDKLDFTLLPWGSIEEVVKVLMFGARKYEADNWKEVSDGYKRYCKAIARHFSDLMKGEEFDVESGLHHAAHIAANALFMLYFLNNK